MQSLTPPFPAVFLPSLTYLLLTMVGCVSFHRFNPQRAGGQSLLPRLNFINEQVLPQSLKFQNTPVGGLSALTYHSPTKTFLALSDDKGKKGSPRFYRLQLIQNRQSLTQPQGAGRQEAQISSSAAAGRAIKAGPFGGRTGHTEPLSYRLQIKEQVLLTKPEGSPFLPIDPEGMAIFSSQTTPKPPEGFSSKTSVSLNLPPSSGEEPPDTLFISSEGAQMPHLKDPPALLAFTPEGQWQKTWPLPPLFWPKNLKNLGTYGVRENKAFEALSLTPDKQHLWLATEQPLHQDHSPPPTAAAGSRGFNQAPFFKSQGFKKSGFGVPSPSGASQIHPSFITWQPLRFSRFEVQKQQITDQFVYPLQTLIKQNHLQGQNGVTDFLSLGGKQLVVIERAYLKDKRLTQKRKLDHNLVRIFFADCSRATNVLKHSSLKQKTFNTCDKKQILDLSDLKHTGPQGATVPLQVDNIEGIALGPEVRPHTRLMVLVSDNNFSATQKTQFLFFHFTIKFQGKVL